jgi:hypothetical protein
MKTIIFTHTGKKEDRKSKTEITLFSMHCIYCLWAKLCYDQLVHRLIQPVDGHAQYLLLFYAMSIYKKQQSPLFTGWLWLMVSRPRSLIYSTCIDRVKFDETVNQVKQKPVIFHTPKLVPRCQDPSGVLYADSAKEICPLICRWYLHWANTGADVPLQSIWRASILWSNNARRS